jgi:hypothetical protein
MGRNTLNQRFKHQEQKWMRKEDERRDESESKGKKTPKTQQKGVGYTRRL